MIEMVTKISISIVSLLCVQMLMQKTKKEIDIPNNADGLGRVIAELESKNLAKVIKQDSGRLQIMV